MRRQVGDTQARIRADHVHGALDEVLEFTTISRPVVTLEKLHDRFTDAVDRADDFHRYRDLVRGTDATDSLFLQDAQQFGLKVGGYGIEFVEEQGPSV
jgi:hypothetical protein